MAATNGTYWQSIAEYLGANEPINGNWPQTIYEQLLAVSGSSNSIQYTEVTLTPSEIINLGTSSKSLLPAAGSGKYYDFERMIFEFNYGSGFAYNEMNGDYFEVRYTQSGEKLLCRIDGTLVSQAVPKIAIVKEFSTAPVLEMNSEIVAAPYLLNEEVHLGTFNYSNLTDNGQTATMTVKMWYYIRTIS